jgi:hypothetical protein
MSSSSPQVLAPVISSRAAELHDKRAIKILAKTIYRELREAGLAEEDVMAVASELLSHVTADVKDRRGVPSSRG